MLTTLPDTDSATRERVYGPPRATDAFTQACGKIRELRCFTESAEAAFSKLAREIQLPDELSTKKSMDKKAKADLPCKINGLPAFCKCDFNQSAGLETSAIFEKITSDVAWEIGLPHATYAFYTDSRGHIWSVSLAPTAKPTAAGEIVEKTSFDPKGWHNHPDLVLKQPRLLPTLLALSAFDLWVGNDDRHLHNILLFDRLNRHFIHSEYAAYGIDLNGCDPYTSILNPGITRLIRNLNTDQVGALEAAAATIQAIETFPLDRINELSARLKPHARHKSRTDEMRTRLIHSRHVPRQQLTRMLPDRLKTELARLI